MLDSISKTVQYVHHQDPDSSASVFLLDERVLAINCSKFKEKNQLDKFIQSETEYPTFEARNAISLFAAFCVNTAKTLSLNSLQDAQPGEFCFLGIKASWLV